MEQPNEQPSADAPALASWWFRVGTRLTALPFGFREHVLTFRPDELHRVRTDDGATIAMGRYLPKGERRIEEPVILCHGLGANRFTFDLTERYSLARRLAERGFEAWILELRGRGEAGRSPSCSFDRQVDFDATAALRTVLATGAKGVLWVGHSKGGLVALAHAGKNVDSPIRAIAALGSPTSFEYQRRLKPFARVVRPLLAAPAVPIQHLARVAMWVPPPAWFMRYLVAVENLEPDIFKKALVNVGSDVSGGVGRQFLRWISSGSWRSLDETHDYTRGLQNIRAPTLLLGGTADLLAPPDAVAAAGKHLAGPVELIIAGRHTGFAVDYGHGDLMLGRSAPDELYPRVIEFLERCGTPASRS